MSNDKDKVKEIRIVDSEGNTFQSRFGEEGVVYEIPIYQRAFAWGTTVECDNINHLGEVPQLLKDVCNCEGNTYYIGSMVVRNKGQANGKVKYEVIDGQQRLTALFIILSCLNWKLKKTGSSFGLKIEPILTYAYRDKSTRAIETLEEVIKVCNNEGSDIVEKRDDKEGDKEERGDKKGGWFTIETGEELESSICTAVEYVCERLKAEGYAQQLFKGLRNVVLYRIEIPDGIDPNQYFEIMNARGKQLEPSDIVKARLMAFLDEKDNTKRECFARIWNACHDMTGYVQMHFENKERDDLFGTQWNEFPTDIDKFYKSGKEMPKVTSSDADESEEGKEDGNDSTMLSAILTILNTDAGIEEQDDAEEISEFKSITHFDNFLLHVLYIYRKRRNEISKEEISDWERSDWEMPDEEIPAEEKTEEKKKRLNCLNEKHLTEKFDEVLDKLKDKDKQERSEWAWNFIICLLKCRYLFDRYFIKSEDDGNQDDGNQNNVKWSINSLKKDKDSYQLLKNDEEEDKRCLMIESCLRVTYTNHDGMYWITRVLDMLYCEYESNNNTSTKAVTKAVAELCETYAGNKAKKALEKLKDNSYRMGTGTPHLLFNYLDYLLWKKNKKEFENFAFVFRNSVEHWYPQHPNTIPTWDDGIGNDNERKLDRDGFGNLCLIRGKENSHFSNQPPDAKLRDLPETMKKGKCGPKCTIMMRLTDNSEQWKNASFKHGKIMLEELANGVGDFDLELEKYKWYDKPTEE